MLEDSTTCSRPTVCRVGPIRADISGGSVLLVRTVVSSIELVSFEQPVLFAT